MEYRIGGITEKLIYWNVGLFAIPMVVFSILSLFNIQLPFLRWDLPFTADWLSLSSNPADLLWKPWSLITYAFLHAGFLHILFNMLMLVFAGRLFMTFFTQKQLFGVYILSAIFAGIVYILSYNTLPMLAGSGVSKMVGASAAIMALLIATAVYSPLYEVRLLLIGRVKLWHIAIVFVVLDLIYASAQNSGGHLAHLAGSLFGFTYIKLLQNGTDLTKGVSAVLDFFANIFKPGKKTPFKTVHRNNAPVQKATAKPQKDITQKQIDDILDKISKSGYDSLTKEEKEFLFKVGK
ncbi:MAG: rhomboid family intramembrane serine protease [Flavobacterium psychrophilum]|nr:MAG: rhomboid family intramembrane serine protease [Flavobacterium psychrophilum]